MRSRDAIVATLALCLYGVSAAGQSRPAVPVLIGGKASAEGCVGTATISVRSGGTLNLRSGPGTGHPAIGRLRDGQRVSVCQRTGDGWAGVIVYPLGVADCGLSDAGVKPRPYLGPCQAGWVSERYLRLFAG